MSNRSLSDIQTRAEGEALLNDPSYEFIGEVILKINIVKTEKIKAEVHVNQDKSLCDLQTLIKHLFLLYFPPELLMLFINAMAHFTPIMGDTACIGVPNPILSQYFGVCMFSFCSSCFLT
jgi:hypothetical protein